MHVYHIKEKYWSMASNFVIKDESGMDLYKIEGKVFSLVDSMSFKDRENNEILHIEQDLMHAMPTYKIIKKSKDSFRKRLEQNGSGVTVMTKESTFQPNFLLSGNDNSNSHNKHDYYVEGHILNREFVFWRCGRGKPVAFVSKKFLKFSRDSYTVRIIDGEDDESILAACIIIDKMLCQ